MTRAAEQMNVAQPALGLQMRQLEQDLGITLLNRHSRGVLPTSAGQLLHERGREILDLVERTTREVAAFNADAAETMSLGLTPSLMQLLASDLLVRVRQDIPGLNLQLVEELGFALLDALKRRELDLAFAYEVQPDASLEAEPWLHESLLLVRAPAPEDRPDAMGLSGSITLPEALRRDLIQADSRDMLRRIVDTASAKLGIPLRIAFEVQSVPAMKILAADGLGASIMPYGVVAAELRGGTLSGFRIREPLLERTLYLVRPEKRSPKTREKQLLAVLQQMRGRLNELLGPLARPAS